MHEGPAGAVGELEEAGKHAVVLRCVGEDGVLEVDAVGDDAVVFIHPKGAETGTLWSYNRRQAQRKSISISQRFNQ